jgi:hypothetical protein
MGIDTLWRMTVLLQSIETHDLIKVLNVDELVNPSHPQVCGQRQAGQEEQNLEYYSKNELIFPSGETLPRCWLDANYRVAS